MVKTTPPLQAGDLHSSIERIAADLQRLDASLKHTVACHEEAAAQITSLKMQVESHTKLLNANIGMEVRLAALEKKADNHEQAFKGHLECINVLTADNEKLAVGLRDIDHRMHPLEIVDPCNKFVYRAPPHPADVVERLSALERSVNDHLANLVEQSPDIDEYMDKKIQRSIKQTQALDLRIDAQEDRLGPVCADVKDINNRLTDIERCAVGLVNTRVATIRNLDSRLLLLEKDFAKADDSTKLKLQLLANTNDQTHVRIKKLEDAGQPPLIYDVLGSGRLDTVVGTIEASLSETTKNLQASLGSVDQACASVENINAADEKASDARCEIIVAQAIDRLRKSDLRRLNERGSARTRYLHDYFKELVDHVNKTNDSIALRLIALESFTSPISADVNSLVEQVASTKDLLDHTAAEFHQKFESPLENHSSRLKVLEDTLSAVQKTLGDLAPTHQAFIDLDGTISRHSAKLAQLIEDIDQYMRRLEALETATSTSSDSIATEIRDLMSKIAYSINKAGRQRTPEDNVATHTHVNPAEVELLAARVVSPNEKSEDLGRGFQALENNALAERLAALEDIIKICKSSPKKTSTQPVSIFVATETSVGLRSVDISGEDSSSRSKSPRVLDLAIINEDGSIKTGEDITIFDAIETLFHSASPNDPNRHKVSDLTNLGIPAAYFSANLQCSATRPGCPDVDSAVFIGLLRKGDIVEVTRDERVFGAHVRLRFRLDSSGQLHYVVSSDGLKGCVGISVSESAEYCKSICRYLLAACKTGGAKYHFLSGEAAGKINPI